MKLLLYLILYPYHSILSNDGPNYILKDIFALAKVGFKSHCLYCCIF